jgi:Icc-related predicted phosphoesterase
MIRVAAVGDMHFGTESHGTYRPSLEHVAERADVLLLAGDLTRHGDPAEAAVLAEELADLPIPVLAVLGNHDYHMDREDELTREIEKAGIRVLEGEAATLQVNGARVGIAGIKGFGGGFAGACGSDFGEPEMKAFIGHTRKLSERLTTTLEGLEADLKIALLHYAPVPETLAGERLEIFPFLGSYLLGEAIDRVGADLVLHGHAHRGSEKGMTPGGVHVRNVAQPVIGHAYSVYCFGADSRLDQAAC